MKHYTFVDYATQGYTALVGLLILFFHNDTVPSCVPLLVIHAVNLALVHWLILLHSRRPQMRGLDFVRHFYPVLLYAWFFCETGLLNRMFFDNYLDPVTIRWDQVLFGCQPSVLFMQRLPYLVVSELFYASYFSYYLMIAGVGIALFFRNREQFFHYLSVISFVFYLCYLVYIILPIAGPCVFFHQVPGYALPPELQQLAGTDVYPANVKAGIFFRLMALLYRWFESPGAAFPSSHVAVACCTVYFSFRYLRRIRFFHLAVAILLCFSTVYCRYHYAVDVLGGLATLIILLPLGNLLYAKCGERLNSQARRHQQAQGVHAPGNVKAERP
jgi:membrane-associated phospholipid phosphatase